MNAAYVTSSQQRFSQELQRLRQSTEALADTLPPASDAREHLLEILKDFPSGRNILRVVAPDLYVAQTHPQYEELKVRINKVVETFKLAPMLETIGSNVDQLLNPPREKVTQAVISILDTIQLQNKGDFTTQKILTKSSNAIFATQYFVQLADNISQKGGRIEFAAKDLKSTITPNKKGHLSHWQFDMTMTVVLPDLPPRSISLGTLSWNSKETDSAKVIDEGKFVERLAERLDQFVVDDQQMNAILDEDKISKKLSPAQVQSALCTQDAMIALDLLEPQDAPTSPTRVHRPIKD